MALILFLRLDRIVNTRAAAVFFAWFIFRHFQYITACAELHVGFFIQQKLGVVDIVVFMVVACFDFPHNNIRLVVFGQFLRGVFPPDRAVMRFYAIVCITAIYLRCQKQNNGSIARGSKRRPVYIPYVRHTMIMPRQPSDILAEKRIGFYYRERFFRVCYSVFELHNSIIPSDFMKL